MPSSVLKEDGGAPTTGGFPNELRLGSIARELCWLRASGLQSPSGSPDAGGVHAWIDEATGSPAYVYSEITGYFITLAVHLARYDRDGRRDWLERAEAAATWIAGVAQQNSGAILCRRYADPERGARDPFSFERKWVPLFDCAMVGFGLLCLHEATGGRRWLEAARRIGEFSLAAFRSDSGRRLHAIYDLRDSRPVEDEPRWSAHFGPFELKCALFLDRLHALTQETRYAELLERILVMALEAQHASGRFPTHPDGLSTHLHPHCYTLEGLLYLAARGRRELLAPAHRGIDWAFRQCLLTSEPVQQYSAEDALVIRGLRCDTVAQALRAYYVIKLLDPALRFEWEHELPALHRRMQAFSLPSGGTSYGRDEYGEKAAHANSWGHFFRVEMSLFREIYQQRATINAKRFIIT